MSHEQGIVHRPKTVFDGQNIGFFLKDYPQTIKLTKTLRAFQAKEYEMKAYRD